MATTPFALPTRQMHLGTAILLLTIAAAVFSLWRQVPLDVREYLNPVAIPIATLQMAAMLYELRRLAVRRPHDSLLRFGWIGTICGGALLAGFVGGVWMMKDEGFEAMFSFGTILPPVAGLIGAMLTVLCSSLAVVVALCLRPFCHARSIAPSAVLGFVTGASLALPVGYFRPPISLFSFAAAASVILTAMAIYATKLAVHDREHRPAEIESPPEPLLLPADLGEEPAADAVSDFESSR